MIMTTFSILEAFARNWWVLLIRGILAVLFAIMAFTVPGLTLVTLVLLYGVYALADGLTALFVGGSSRSWSLVLAGVIGVIVGIGTFIVPGITAVALLYLIAAWAFVRGIFEVVTAIELRKEIRHEWLLIIAGVFSIMFGLALIANPVAGALAVVSIIGAYAFVFGLMMIVLSFRLRSMPRNVEKFA
jgi:uncharacterized membrane protein HdeD (DUF308 family)